ncbi:hypothetical protein FISHEDRAFT_76241 [Fistulina hepatica ATCC 64428]|uniref:PHD-type domain-containing protein n=1 Tax=Fistulina hepatica ATCC 64428 TaxID=1128425 RepID=A0A0D7A6Z7_9AGAR|nr:hypothetical protein FISHEDRAFT_76241 [Fistulina hepatica ATCC 64428]
MSATPDDQFQVDVHSRSGAHTPQDLSTQASTTPRRFSSQLLTPHSPNNASTFIHYMPHGTSLPFTPESPVANTVYYSSFPSVVGVTDRIVQRSSSQPGVPQTMTPDSSPFATRAMTPSTEPPSQSTFSVKLESPISIASNSNAGPSASNFFAEPPNQAPPLMARLGQMPAILQQPYPQPFAFQAKNSYPAPIFVNDVFSSTQPAQATSFSPPPPSLQPPPELQPAAELTSSGGELARIREAHFAEIQDSEARRPDYLKRDIDASSLPRVIGNSFGGVGIMDSPNKGRRIKLFQETSEESFEESLMAGGYGRYVSDFYPDSFNSLSHGSMQRTTDWLRQPSVSDAQTPGSTNTEEGENAAPATPPPPPTEKELRKSRRLGAFRGQSVLDSKYGPPTKLTPVELEGKGRVLLDVSLQDLQESLNVPEATLVPAPKEAPPEEEPPKKGKGRRKKKATAEARTLMATVTTADRELAALDKPDWPDNYFPWRLRTAERNQIQKREEEERLKWIERFLDRDDTEDDQEEDTDGANAIIKPVWSRRDEEDEEDEEIQPSATWGVVYEDGADRPQPPRRGRGKMVPFTVPQTLPYIDADPDPSPPSKGRSFFPSDPADARAALLAKRNVRALAYQRRRQARLAAEHARKAQVPEVEVDDDEEDDEVQCICDGEGSGDVVQCDECHTWYHLRCLKLKKKDLGRDEDLWFCSRCEVGMGRVRSRSTLRRRLSESSTESIGSPVEELREPTFVPTDDAPGVRRTYETFLQPSGIQDSPGWPRQMPNTPRGRRAQFNADPDVFDAPSTPSRGMRTSTGSIWSGWPTTPKGFSTPGPVLRGSGGLHTPGRNLFQTPSRNLFQTPNRSALQTPTRARGMQSRTISAFGSAGAMDNRYSNMFTSMDDSPVRRSGWSDRSSLNLLAQQAVLEESPVVRSASKRDT